MEQKMFEESKALIMTLFVEKQWLKGYTLTIELMQKLDIKEENYAKDMYFCNTYLSIGSRRLGDNQSAINFANIALEYSDSEKQNIFIYNTLANCYGEAGDTIKASEYYDRNIQICNEELNNFKEDYLINEKLYILTRKADAIHNKGDLLGDSKLIYESINLYNKVLADDNCSNKKTMNKNIANAYKNLDRIHNQLSTPLLMVL